MLWLVFGSMLLVASLIAVWPLYRDQQRLSLIGALVIVIVIGLSASLYSAIGTPDAELAAERNQSTAPSVDDMVASLATRLQESPEDIDGWKMLGRSYLQLDKPLMAVAAFETAVELENSNNGETLISLGEAILASDQTTLAGRAGRLFESGLALAPDYSKALFFGGLSAAQRGEHLLAADRWETFLQQSPPVEIQDTLRKRISEWRGEPVPSVQGTSVLAKQLEAVVSVDIQIADNAVAAIDPDATVFIIARDPAQPSPPLAAVRRTAGELPTVVKISDEHAMVPGRVPSAYAELEIIVRVSISGQPIAKTGDWYGDAIFRADDGNTVSITVDQQVP